MKAALLQNISSIIFDLGGVLIDVDYNKTIRAFEKLGIENARELYSQQSQSTLFNEIECGEISPIEFLTELSKIAQKVMGSTKKTQLLIDINRDVMPDPNSIRPGMVLQYPKKTS